MIREEFAVLVERAYQARVDGDRMAALALFQQAEQVIPLHSGVLLETAAELLAIGRLAEAELIYDDILRADPSHFGALVQHGHLERSRGNRLAALKDFQAAGIIEPTHVGLLLEIIRELRALDRPDDTTSVFQQILKAEPKHFDSLVELALFARRSGDRQQSLIRFMEALGAYPVHTGLMLEAAHDLVGLSRPADAKKMYLRCLDTNADNPAAMIGLGLLARRNGETAAAIEHFRAALAIDPALDGAQLELAHDLREAGRFEEARNQIDVLLARDAQDHQVLLLAGHLGRAMGDQAAALAAFRKAVELQPNDPQILVECALEERIAGNPGNSATLLAQALELDPSHLPSLMQSSEHALLADDPEQALKIARSAIDVHPTASPTYVQTSRSLAALGRPDEALDLLQLGLIRCSDPVTLKVQQIEILRRGGHWQEAGTVLDGCSGVQQDFDLWTQACRLYLETGDFPSLGRAMSTPPANTKHQQAIVLQLQGELAETLWDFPTARKHLAEAIELHPLNGNLHNILARFCMVDLDFAEARIHLERAVQLDASAIILRGHSSNPAQSHLGQLFNELRMDPEITAKLLVLRDQPAEAQLDPLRAVVVTEPGHTGAAMRLLIAARRIGLFAGRPDDSVATSAIPRRITQFWNQKLPPPDVMATMESWRSHNPGFTYERLDDDAAFTFIRETYDAATVLAFRRSREPAQRSDLFRLAWLYEKGGIYADADDLCLASVDGLLGGWTMIAYQEEYGSLGNNFLAVIPRHAVIGEALRVAVGAINRNESDMIWLKTGPGLLTRSFAVAMSRTVMRPGCWLSGTRILERHELRHVSLPQIGLMYKRTNLHWMRNIGGQAVKARP